MPEPHSSPPRTAAKAPSICCTVIARGSHQVSTDSSVTDSAVRMVKALPRRIQAST